MNILLIGGTGFLGSYLNQYFSEKNHLDFTYANQLNKNGIKYSAGKDLLSEVTSKKYDIVINNINPLNLSYIQTLQCIEDVVSFCNHSGAKLIHISSISALLENRFSNCYNLKKAIPEDYIQTEMNSDNYSILRFTQLFDAKGLSRKSQAGLYYLLKEIKSGNPITIFSNNKVCYRNYMPVELAISIIEEIISKKMTGVFNAHLDVFTLSFDELIRQLTSLNKNYSSKELIVVGEKEGLPYYIPKQSNELVLKINRQHDLMYYFTNAYNLI
jgi:nucleoside-diphosphate-sugar epimerase